MFLLLLLLSLSVQASFLDKKVFKSNVLEKDKNFRVKITERF